MDIDITAAKTGRLEETIDQLTDEYRFNFLGVLEALNFAQNVREIPVTETVELYQ